MSCEKHFKLYYEDNTNFGRSSDILKNIMQSTAVVIIINSYIYFIMLYLNMTENNVILLKQSFVLFRKLIFKNIFYRYVNELKII